MNQDLEKELYKAWLIDAEKLIKEIKEILWNAYGAPARECLELIKDYERKKDA